MLQLHYKIYMQWNLPMSVKRSQIGQSRTQKAVRRLCLDPLGRASPNVVEILRNGAVCALVPVMALIV